MKVYIHDAVEQFFTILTKSETAKVLRTLDLLERFGAQLSMPHSKHLKNGLLELRVRGKREIRFFYCFNKGGAVVLHGVIKKTQKTALKDIELAHHRKKELA